MIDIRPDETVVAVRLHPSEIGLLLDRTMYRDGDVELRYGTCFDRIVDRMVLVDGSTRLAAGEIRVRAMRQLGKECGYRVYAPLRYHPRKPVKELGLGAFDEWAYLPAIMPGAEPHVPSRQPVNLTDDMVYMAVIALLCRDVGCTPGEADEAYRTWLDGKTRGETA